MGIPVFYGIFLHCDFEKKLKNSRKAIDKPLTFVYNKGKNCKLSLLCKKGADIYRQRSKKPSDKRNDSAVSLEALHRERLYCNGQ